MCASNYVLPTRVRLARARSVYVSHHLEVGQHVRHILRLVDRHWRPFINDVLDRVRV
jgi:hypothetical protein